MTSRQLEYFLAVARDLNFTKAAESMYVSQTAVTQQIKALEDQLGVRLFERTKRHVELTAAGKVFQPEATAILNRIDEAVQRTREVKSGFIGTLNIGFTTGLGNTMVSERIRAFYRYYPNILMRFTNLGPDALGQQLRNGLLDVALMPLFHEKFFRDFDYCKVAQDQLMAVMPWDHLLAQNQYMKWKDLADEPLIVAAAADTSMGEDKLVMDNFARRGYQPNVVDVIADVDTIMFMVSCHMGIAILPEYLAAPEMVKGRITAVPIGARSSHLDIVAAWKPDNDNPSLERILPFLQEEFLWDPVEDSNAGNQRS